ncbi:hypothetical protein GN956_G3683 [Arapaima gigas]
MVALSPRGDHGQERGWSGRCVECLLFGPSCVALNGAAERLLFGTWRSSARAPRFEDYPSTLVPRRLKFRYTRFIKRAV